MIHDGYVAVRFFIDIMTISYKNVREIASAAGILHKIVKHDFF